MFRKTSLTALTIALITASVVIAPAEEAVRTSPEIADPVGIADLKTLEDAIQNVLKRVTPSVVGVSGGTGVVVSEDGHVLTVAHVGVRAGRDVTVVLPDGRRARGRTQGNDHGLDMGLVKITDPGPWPHVEMGKSGDLKMGQWCLAVGYPVSFEHGKRPVVRIGRVQRSISPLIITDCAIMGGDSGGPLFDLDGKVIGVSSRCENRITTNVHVPIDRFHESWERLTKGEDFNSRRDNVAFLGVGPGEEGDTCRIGTVIPGSAAEKAGLQVGDIVVKIDGLELKGYADLPPIIRKRKPGEEVEIEVRRGGKIVRLKATLGERGD